MDLASHAGTVQLDDGRLLYVDDEAARVQALTIDEDGVPQIVGSAVIPATRPWTRAGWLAVDPSQRYLAVSSLDEDPADQTVTVVDLETYEADRIDVALRPGADGEFEEAHVYLAGSPLQLVVSTGGRFETFSLGPILAGQSPAATSSAPLGAGNHGPVVSPDGSAVASTTADGVDIAPLSGAALGVTRSIAYSSSRDTVANHRPSLARDGVSIWGVAAEDTGLVAAEWAATRNDVSVVDPAAATSVLRRIPDGLTSRLALSSTVAAASTIGGEGDTHSLIDADPRSATYQRLVGVVALPPLSRGPVGAYLTVVQQGEEAVDLIGR